ncbi:MAG: hypothetical protein AB7S26_09415 [Sandaracinaceae bacterium]
MTAPPDDDDAIEDDDEQDDDVEDDDVEDDDVEDDDVDAKRGRDDAPARAKEEIFEAIDHFKNAASILFDRANNDPALKSATKEVRRVVDQVSVAAEPLAKGLTAELGRLTKDMMKAVESTTKAASTKAASTKAASTTAKPKRRSEEEE